MEVAQSPQNVHSKLQMNASASSGRDDVHLSHSGRISSTGHHLESAGPGDPAFDFRYLPGQANTVDIFLEVQDHYERLRRRALDVNRVMARHTRGGAANSWVDELETRLRSVRTLTVVAGWGNVRPAHRPGWPR